MPNRRTLRPGKAKAIRDKLAAAFLLGLVLFTPPLLLLFAKGGRLAGIPVLYLYIFGAWIGLTALLALVVERGERSQPPPRGE